MWGGEDGEHPTSLGLLFTLASGPGRSKMQSNPACPLALPFDQTTQGNRLSCRDQEERRGSEEAVPGPSVFPSGEPGVSGDFWAIKVK